MANFSFINTSVLIFPFCTFCMHFLMQSFVANKEEVGILRTQDYSFSQHC